MAKTSKPSEQAPSPWIGKKAPAFSLPDQEGKTHKLSEYKGKWVVLYAYPKDATSGCTAESCGFRDSQAELAKLNAVSLGISILDVKSKQKFAAKFGLNFPLLADEDHAVLEQYNLWQEKSMYGRKYWGVNRETFIIDPQGKIAAHWPKAPGSESHAEEILAWLKANAR